MLAGHNPYVLVGPGKEFVWDYPLFYPATSFVAVIPFSFMPEWAATAFFVLLSSFVLTFAMTKKSWHLLPLLASVPFFHNARLAQWGTIVTATLFVPALGGMLAIKPQASIPVLLSFRSQVPWSTALGATILFFALSFAFLPHWPVDWLALLRSSTAHMKAPILRPGGFVVLVLLTRWRRPESWLVLAMACMPQTWDSYNVLPLLTIAGTYQEATLASLTASLGALTSIYYIQHSGSLDELFQVGGTLMVVYAYIPAVFIILGRPNTGEAPWWIQAAGASRLFIKCIAILRFPS